MRRVVILTLTFQTLELRRVRSIKAHYQTGERATSTAGVTSCNTREQGD